MARCRSNFSYQNHGEAEREKRGSEGEKESGRVEERDEEREMKRER